MTRGVGLPGLLGLSLLILIGVRYTEPIPDTDLFWHLAYARQMLQRWSLIPDHTAFSWTPASNTIIYCVWMSDLVLYALWRLFGLAGLFVLRYVLVLGMVALTWNFARRVGLGRSPLTYLVLGMLTLGSYIGTLIKPELFSLLFMGLIVWAVFRAKLAQVEGHDPVRWLYVIPLVMILWVNAHGGFILAAPFLGAVVIGEGLNLFLSPGVAFPRRVYGHLLTSWALAGLGVLATPYGVRYPRQLIADYVFQHTPRPDVAWNNAYQSIFAPGALAFHFPEFLVLMGLILAGLLALQAWFAPPGGRVDWMLVLANVVSLPLFIVYLRSTYFWPPVFAYSVLWLGRALAAVPAERMPWRQRPRAGRAMAEITIAVGLFLAGRGCYEAWARPFYASWLGWGVSYVSPVVEAEFLAAHRLGPRLYNIFDSGGYLLWRLDPTYKVMVDSRSFPYLSWFADQERFARGEIFEEFLARYPGADVAVIDLAKADSARNFARSPDWRLVFYGPTAAVFVRRAVALPDSARGFRPDRLLGLRNAVSALRVFDFATEVGDYKVAWDVLGQIETQLRHQINPETVRRPVAYREAHRALKAGDYARARAQLAEALNGLTPGDHDLALVTSLDARARLAAAGQWAEAAGVEATLRKLAAPDGA